MGVASSGLVGAGEVVSCTTADQRGNKQRKQAMTDSKTASDRGGEFWHRGKVTRRRLIGYGATAGALGATMLVPAPWQRAFGQAKPYKIGTLQPLSGVGAAGGKTALVGVQMAADRINKSGGINGRPIELTVADDESKPDVGRRKAEKLVVEDKIDVQVGGFLSNICLACMPVWEENKVVNMIGVCLDTTLTTSKCNRYTFRPFDYAPAQAVAFAPHLVNKMGKKWHIAYADYAWGQSTRDAYAEQIKKAGGEVVGTTGIPLNRADMTPFLSKINGNFDGLFGIFFGADGVTIGNQAYDLGLTKKYKWAGDGAIAESTNLPALGNKIEGFVGINRYLPVLEGVLNTPWHKKFFDDAVARLKAIDPSGPLPDRYVQSNYEAMNALKIGMEKSGFRGREDTMKLIEALEGLEMKEGDDFPQGDKVLRKEDHQAFLREFIFDIKDGKHRILDVVPKEKTIFPPACKFASS
jgi:branched-chain amino acid transport system substrate-binding protein